MLIKFDTCFSHGAKAAQSTISKKKISIQCLLNQCLKLSVKMRDGANICSNCIILQMILGQNFKQANLSTNKQTSTYITSI